MEGSVAKRISDHVAALPSRSFVAVRDVEGPRGPVESAFSRLAASGVLRRVRKGLYWKGARTPMGVSRPSVEEVALRLGGPGSGPAGAAAAHWLGMSSQVPSTFVTAVPARVPKSWQQIRFTQRPVERLLRALTASEVAVIEVLRAGPAATEGRWERLGEIVADLAAVGEVRPDVLSAEIADEPHQQARARWAELCRTRPR